MVEWAFSGAQARHSTTCSCSRNSALHSLEPTTQTRTVWSFEQLAINEPSWLGRTILTHSLWPVNVFTQYLEMGHCQLQQMKMKAHHRHLPSGDFPHLHGLVSWGRHYVVAIWHDGYRGNIVVVAWKHRQGMILQLLRVHLYRIRLSKSSSCYSTWVLTMHCSDTLKPLKVPQLDAHISWTWSQQFSCLVKRYVLYRVCVTLQGSLKVPCLIVPHLEWEMDSNSQGTETPTPSQIDNDWGRIKFIPVI